MRAIATFFAVLLLSSCMSTRVQFSPKWERSSKPVYIDYVDSYVFGFIGQPSLNLQKICMDQKPYALHSVKTAEDGIITFFTLGIYSPTTVRVWCGD